MAKRKLVYVPLDELKRADKNPKDHAPDAIRASIGEFGYVEPQIVDDRTGKLVAGHGRLDFLVDERDNGRKPPEGIVVTKGVWTVPVIYGWQSKDDDEAHALGIALNRGAELGGWKRDLLYADLTELAARAPRLLDATGFGHADIDDLRTLGAPPVNLERLGKELGQPKPEDFWPVIRLTVNPETKQRWDALVEEVGQGIDSLTVDRIVELATLGLNPDPLES